MNRHIALGAFAVIAFAAHDALDAQVAVVSEAVVENAAAPGQTYQGRLLVRNTGKDPQEARIYLTDYSFTADGRTDYAAAGTKARSNAKWIELSPTYVSIPPETTVPVTYTVSVPAESALRGTYWSMIMVEGIVAGSPTSKQPNARVQVGLSVVTRYGTQVATHIGSTGTSHLAFDSLMATTGENGSRGLRYDFINTGERAHRFTMSLELYNEAGDLVKKANQTRGLLYPGTAARQLFDLGELPHGEYTAVLVADGGGDQVFGGQFKVAY